MGQERSERFKYAGLLVVVVFFLTPQSLNRRVLIDTGEANRPDYIQLLRETLSQAHASLNHVIITHRHLDHIGGVDGVRKMNPGGAKSGVASNRGKGREGTGWREKGGGGGGGGGGADALPVLCFSLLACS